MIICFFIDYIMTSILEGLYNVIFQLFPLIHELLILLYSTKSDIELIENVNRLIRHYQKPIIFELISNLFVCLCCKPNSTKSQPKIKSKGFFLKDINYKELSNKMFISSYCIQLRGCRLRRCCCYCYCCIA